MNILVTGGAGYIGTVLVRELLSLSHYVTVYDNLLHGGDSLLPFIWNPRFSFVQGDVRDYRLLREECRKHDSVIHLAAIVGAPACARDDKAAHAVNFQGSRNLTFGVSSQQHVVYASTVSVYGRVLNGVCTEDTPANPLTQYGITKHMAEQEFMSHTQCTALRFPTAFGVSPRMRTDLMPNDLTYRAMKDGYAVVYEADVRRTFIHVHDVARAVLFALDNPDKTVGHVFNPGDESLNVTKRELCEVIRKETGAQFFFAEVGSDGDKRDYEVSFQKIKQAGFKTHTSLEKGIWELARASRLMHTPNKYANI